MPTSSPTITHLVDPVHDPKLAHAPPPDVVFSLGTDDWDVPEDVLKHKYFVLVKTNLADAMDELHNRMRANNDHRLFTRKRTRPFGGTILDAGQVGVWSRNGRPVLSIKPGNYWNISWRHKFMGKYSLTATIDLLGLTICQVGQSEAAVIMDPSNRIFIIRNSGFVAFGAEGRFKVIAIVDTLNLGDACAHREPNMPGTNGTNRILGWKRDVKTVMEGSDGSRTEVTVATFFNVPANNVLILQRGNDLIVLKAGQHVITNPNTLFRGFFSLGERQTTFKTQPAYTIEGVPVVLHVNLRYRVADPVLLTSSYEDAFQALGNPAQTAVNSVVSRLSYQQFMRAKNVGGDVPDFHTAPWLDSFKSECLKDLTRQAKAYGIVVESFDVLDRELEGKLGKDLEAQSEQVLRNQVQATQVELQNHIATETQRGKLEIAKVEAEQKKTQADAEFYVQTKKADANAYQVVKSAEAEADASNRRTTQEAKNVVTLADAKRIEIEIISKAYSQVPEGHAQRMQLSVFEVEKRKALPQKTIYFTGDKNETNHFGQDSVVNGFMNGTGWNAGSTLAH
ncbi:hypothetical protein HK098_007115 [Nowakowskiella sp. JEL0407]|nr:hypothetical protein HK098_007115 [Nowakowskiella sp. JEL0407]